jgi:SAM-dependent methyltransferase
MSEEAANPSGSRMRHRPLRVPVDEVARHSSAAQEEGAQAAAPAAPAAPEPVVAKPSRASVVAMKSVIVTGMASRKLSQPPPAMPAESQDPVPLVSLKQVEPEAAPAAAPAPAPEPAAALAGDSADFDLVVEAADASAASEIADAAESEAAAAAEAEAVAKAEQPVQPRFNDEVSSEITIENVADASGDDDVLDMDDLEEVSPTKPPITKTTPAIPAAPAVPSAHAAPAAPAAAAAPPAAPAAAAVAAPPAAPAAASAPLAPPGPAKRKPWFDDFFSDDYLRTVRAPTPKEVARECDAILAMLKLDPGAIILDVGCGLGMHAIELTMRGYIVIGLDLSLPMLSRAADEAQDRGIKINFLHADMREMAFEGGFDAVLCWGTTFGYFDDDGNRSVVERFYSALKPGGRLLIDVVNRDHVIQSQPNLVWFEGDGCICMEETDFNYFSSRLNVKRNVILDNGRQHDRHYSIRLYALHELGMLLQQQGFRTVEVTGRYATPGVFFGAQSPRMIVLAERRVSVRDTPPPSSTPSVPPPPPPAGNGDAAKAEAAKAEAAKVEAAKAEAAKAEAAKPAGDEGETGGS